MCDCHCHCHCQHNHGGTSWQHTIFFLAQTEFLVWNGRHRRYDVRPGPSSERSVVGVLFRMTSPCLDEAACCYTVREAAWDLRWSPVQAVLADTLRSVRNQERRAATLLQRHWRRRAYKKTCEENEAVRCPVEQHGFGPHDLLKRTHEGVVTEIYRAHDFGLIRNDEIAFLTGYDVRFRLNQLPGAALGDVILFKMAFDFSRRPHLVMDGPLGDSTGSLQAASRMVRTRAASPVPRPRSGVCGDAASRPRAQLAFATRPDYTMSDVDGLRACGEDDDAAEPQTQENPTPCEWRAWRAWRAWGRGPRWEAQGHESQQWMRATWQTWRWRPSHWEVQQEDQHSWREQKEENQTQKHIMFWQMTRCRTKGPLTPPSLQREEITLHESESLL